MKRRPTHFISLPNADLSTSYSYTLHGSVLALHDFGTERRIADDPDHVLAHLQRTHGVSLSGRRVVYRDPNGIWQELRVENGAFAGFEYVRDTVLLLLLAELRLTA